MNRFLAKHNIALQSTTLFSLFVFVLFITPNLPMPSGVLGPIGPITYILITAAFFVFTKKYNPAITKNNYFRIYFFLSFLIILSDLLNLILYSFQTEIKFLMIRVLNFFIFLVFAQMMIIKNKSSGLYEIHPFLLKVFIWSIYFIAFILFGQAFGFINIGEVYPGRTYFGLPLPFNKPVGLTELSDGKLGIIIAPIIFLALLAINKKISLVKMKWPYFVVILFTFLLFIMQSRSAYVGLFTGVIAFILLYPSRKVKYFFIGSGIAGLAFLWMTGILSFLIGGLVGEGIYATNVDSRNIVLFHAIDMFKESPLWGVGHAALVLQNRLYDDVSGLGSHNLFADQLGSGGLISFLPFACIFIMFFYYSLKLYFIGLKLKKMKQVGFAIWLISSMIYIITELFFYRGFYNEYVCLFFAFGIIACLNYTILRSKEKNDLKIGET